MFDFNSSNIMNQEISNEAFDQKNTARLSLRKQKVKDEMNRKKNSIDVLLNHKKIFKNEIERFNVGNLVYYNELSKELLNFVDNRQKLSYLLTMLDRNDIESNLFAVSHLYSMEEYLFNIKSDEFSMIFINKHVSKLFYMIQNSTEIPIIVSI